MFDILRKALTTVIKNINEKELSEKDITDTMFKLEILLLESDVAMEVIESIKNDLNIKLLGMKTDKNKVFTTMKNILIQNITTLLDSVSQIDIFSCISKKTGPYIIIFVGINGTGKTTTLAKFVYLLKKLNFTSVIAAADTYRAGAIEQLQEHAHKLNTKLVLQNYGSDPAAVARDAILYANSHNIDCVLIDTAGRMQNSKNLMDQISKIVNVSNPDLKIFVGDSLAGSDMVNQAREFYKYIKFDGAVLTKADADSHGGAALSIIKITSKPILYLGTGQNYETLEPFDKNIFLQHIFNESCDVAYS